MATEIIAVSPGMARRWLKGAARVNFPSRTAVERYSDTMARGEWIAEASSIRLGEGGALIDGMHRLLAIVRHGNPVAMTVETSDETAAGLRSNETKHDVTGNMQTIFMDITPAMAAEWLKKNTSNRKISEKVVNKYASDIMSGKWSTTHQGIAFYSDGILADGQQRLSAIVKTGCTVKMAVTFGLDRAAGADIDAHRARSMDDAIRIAGGHDWIGRNEVAVAKMFFTGGKTPSSHEIVDFCEKYRPSITFAASAFSSKRKHLTAAPIIHALALAHINGVDEAKLARFATVLLSGVPDGLHEVAAIRLREYLMSGQNGLAGVAQRIDSTLRAQRAIKAFVAGEQIAKLYAPAGPIWRLP